MYQLKRHVYNRVIDETGQDPYEFLDKMSPDDRNFILRLMEFEYECGRQDGETDLENKIEVDLDAAYNEGYEEGQQVVDEEQYQQGYDDALAAVKNFILNRERH